MRTRPTRLDPGSETGGALLAAVLVLTIAAVVGGSAALVSSTDFNVSSNYRESWQAFYAADGSSRAALHEVVRRIRNLSRFPTDAELAGVPLPAIGGVTYSDFEVRATAPASQGTLTSGFFHGLVADSTPYVTRLTASTDGIHTPSASVSLGLRVDLIPVFGFALLAEGDLVLTPPLAMNLNGRVHGNADVFLSAGDSLTIDGIVTSSGQILHAQPVGHPATGPDFPPVDGPVLLRRGEAAFTAMALDSRDPDWTDRALETWNGNVRSGAHGVPRLRLTVPDPDNPRQIIEPGLDTDTAEERAAKLFYHAGMSINIVNGHGFDAAGNEINLKPAIRFDVLFDQRELKDMLIVEVDIDKLSRLAEYPAGGPAVVYIGSFRPGNGLPEWELTETPLGDLIIEDFSEWADDYYAGKPHGDIKDALAKLGDAYDECLKSHPKKAAKKVGEAGEKLQIEVDKGHLVLAVAQEQFATFAPLATCEPGVVTTETADWPRAWKDKPKPYNDPSTAFAVKIENADTLPDGLTIITANPMYVRGDFNTVTPKPAALIADAFTQLSNGWKKNDKVHSRKDLASRTATDTTLNAALMVGSTGGDMVRFLEDWNGRTFTYTGSIVTLWQPQIATGAWTYGAPVYRAPLQNWTYDQRLRDPANHPPATPTVHALMMTHWRRQ